MYEIIYVDDSLADRRIASTAHKESGVSAPLRSFSSGAAFLAYVDSLPAEDRTPRVVLLDLNMPGDGGLAVLRKLKMRASSVHMMVWMFSNSRWLHDHDTLKQAGAVRLLSKPTDYLLTVEMFRELGDLLEPRTERAPTNGVIGRVLLVEDSPADALLLRESLLTLAPTLQIEHVTTLASAHEWLNRRTFDGLVLDLHLPDAQETAGLVSILAAWPRLPIVAVSGRYDGQLARALVRQGAQDFISKAQLEARSLLLLLEFAAERQHILNKLRQELSRTRSDALIDAFTGLPNRRALLDAYRLLSVNIDPNADASCALVVIDIDGLKQVNDRHGHRLGDELIQLVTMALKDRLRPGDLLARIGGDEFVMLLQDLPPGDWVELMVERMRSAVDAIPPLLGGQIRPRASFGHAMLPPGGAEFDTVFAIADMRMYRDKALHRHLQSPGEV